MSNLAVRGGRKTIDGDPHRAWPEILEADRAAVSRVIDRGNFAGANAPEITALQREYAEYLGAQYCLATNSGTAALHCCVAALGLVPGDEVIVPAYTFVASAMAVAHQGAVPVFCDVDQRTYNLDPKLLEDSITERTKAILAVHIHGQPADLDEIIAIAERRAIPVIEDNAQAHGIRYRGRFLGTIGACSGTSLNQSKNLSAGEGGLFVTDDEQLYRAARRLSVFGEDLVPLEERAFWSHGVGWNYRNQELSCALARAQLPRLERFNATAMANAEILTEGLHGLEGIEPPYVAEDRECSYWKYMVQIDPDALGFDRPATELRDRILFALRAEGVQCMIWQPQPVPAQPAFRRALRPWAPQADEESLEPWEPQAFPVASRLCDTSLSLGTEAKPLYVQDRGVMESYVEAFHKVMDDLDAVLEGPYIPVKRLKGALLLFPWVR
jgi:dTDP-4-amino-4,6-dideoxygalactose transaminase